MPTKSKRKKIIFKAAAAVCGAGSLGGCPLVRLVLAALSAIYSLLSSTAVSLRLSPPLFLLPWAPPVAYACQSLLNVASIPCHLAMNRSAASRTPRYHLPAFFAATVYTSASTTKTNLECSVDPLVASNALRPSDRHLCQLFGFPPGLRPLHRSSSRASPAWVIAPRFVVRRPPRRRAAVYG